MNYLTILFAGVLVAVVGLFLIFGLSGTPLAETNPPTTGPVATRTQLPSGPPRTVNTTPSLVKPFFRSMKTVYSARAFRFNGSAITLGDYESDMNKWRVEFPLNFTHVRFTGQNKIFKFNRPNTSDSSGYIVDDMDQRMNPQPASFYGNTIEFGMFF